MLIATPIGQDDVSIGPPRFDVRQATQPTSIMTALAPAPSTAPAMTVTPPPAPTGVVAPAPMPPAALTPAPTPSGCPWWCWLLIAAGGVSVVGITYYITRD